MEDEIDLLGCLRILIKRKWFIVGLALVAALYALYTSSKQPVRYEATVSIMTVQGGEGGLFSALEGVSFFGGGGAARGSDAKLVPVLKSASLAKQVAQGLDLDLFFPQFSKAKETSEEQKARMVVGSLQGAVQTKSSDGLMNVSIVWRDPEQAAELANHYVEQLGKFIKDRSLGINFQILDPAVVPVSPIDRKIKKKAMLAGVLGLFMGIFIAFFLEYVEKLLKVE